MAKQKIPFTDLTEFKQFVLALNWFEESIVAENEILRFGRRKNPAPICFFKSGDSIVSNSKTGQKLLKGFAESEIR